MNDEIRQDTGGAFGKLVARAHAEKRMAVDENKPLDICDFEIAEDTAARRCEEPTLVGNLARAHLRRLGQLGARDEELRNAGALTLSNAQGKRVTQGEYNALVEENASFRRALVLAKGVCETAALIIDTIDNPLAGNARLAEIARDNAMAHLRVQLLAIRSWMEKFQG